MKKIKYNKSIKKIRLNKKTLAKGLLITLPILLIAVFSVLYFFIIKDIPKVTTIGQNDFPQSTNIFDRNGELLYTIYAQRNQIYVPLDKIPEDLQNATISIEDKDFYNHGAVDLRGIARALYVNTFTDKTQGGSTLTQQLVKNSLLTPERTVTRKVKEVILSFAVEGIYGKDKILEMYLNKVPYGGTAWGVEAASQVYFNKPVSDLTLAESAFIAALPEAPSIYSPFGSHPERGKQKQLQVLKNMREQGYITEEEEKKAKEETLTFSEFQNNIRAPHFVFYIKDILVQKYGQATVEQGGLAVTTSLDIDIQDFAQLAVASEVAKLEDSNVSNAASVVTNPATGEILAMVGGKDFFDTETDGNVNVTIAKRQPGSSIKPINYATGLILGYTAATPFIDKKTCFPNPGGRAYCPVNYDGGYHGVTQMRYALANSYNIPAVKMLKLNGLDAMIATASAMGIDTFTEPDRYGLSLTLGGGEVTMLDMAEAFGVFANMGYKIDLHPILKVVDKNGEILEEYNPPKSPIFGDKAIPEGVAFIISDILQDNGARAQAFGTNSPLRIEGQKVSVKTGTTNDFRDNWTIGYTPSFVTAVWVGNNDNTPMRGIVSGVSGAAPIWNTIMTHLLEGKDPEFPKKPDSVISKLVCSTSGLLPNPEAEGCPTRYEYFIIGSEPTQQHPGRQKHRIDVTTGEVAPGDQTENVEEKDEVVIFDPLKDSYCLTCPKPEPEEKKEE